MPLFSGQAVLKASEFKFEPAAFRLAAGQPVKLVLQNGGAEAHDLRAFELGAGGTDIQVFAGPGEQSSVEFTPGRPGVFVFICTISGHEVKGMAGRVEVLAPGSGSPSPGVP